jgi:CRP-like cAMP-binding protein
MISPELLRRYPFFSSVKDESLKKIAMITDEKEAPAGRILHHENESASHLYVIQEGEVDIQYVLGTGEYKTVYTVVAGELMLWTSLIAPYKTRSVACVKKPVKLIAIDAPKLREMFAADPLLGYRIMYELTKAVGERLAGAVAELAVLS